MISSALQSKIEMHVFCIFVSKFECRTFIYSAVFLYIPSAFKKKKAYNTAPTLLKSPLNSAQSRCFEFEGHSLMECVESVMKRLFHSRQFEDKTSSATEIMRRYSYFLL